MTMASAEAGGGVGIRSWKLGVLSSPTFAILSLCDPGSLIQSLSIVGDAHGAQCPRSVLQPPSMSSGTGMLCFTEAGD